MIAFYLFLAAFAFLMLYFVIKKLTLQIDERELSALPKVEIYPEFCDFIASKLSSLKEEIKNDENALVQSDLKDEYLELISDLNRKLTFIQTMNLSKKNDEIWQNELFSFLKELEEILLKYLKNGEEKADELRNELMNEFQRLKQN
ncbi:hypothetical protein DMB92_03605 [Campylobacter sp. MIT 99-7217]|uniref:hypothetical protein n=1 Tax=Campylobacter sp. MIT 99-7217 TaxID=535091 RepID=UPI00115ABA50|nr:hypothetical protein [Campylobacter sp. MIT 99-7217]TQR33055.1 hypothetical protein DMB92_03605 [Campylobacter sp. MIT 99-7217]